MASIILASTSPRREALLRQTGLKDFAVEDPCVDEWTRPGMPPEDAVEFWAKEKAKNVAEKSGPEDIIIAADTVVWFSGRLWGKPEDEEDIVRTLERIHGDWHRVYTGVTVMRGGESQTEIEVTRVLMRNLTPEQIAAYAKTGEAIGKAGAYAIQGRGSQLIERIEGDYTNVVGLPLYRLSRMLERYNVDFLMS